MKITIQLISGRKFDVDVDNLIEADKALNQRRKFSKLINNGKIIGIVNKDEIESIIPTKIEE